MSFLGLPGCCYAALDGDANPPNNQRGILSMYKNKKFYMNLPEIYGRRCWGTPYGWIVTLGRDLQLHLFNPLNRRRIALPEVTCERTMFDDENEKSDWIRRVFRQRAILIKRPPGSYSSSPGYDDFLVVAIDVMGFLTVMRPHSNTWHTLGKGAGSDKSPAGYLFDVVSCNDKIYALGVSGRLMVCYNLDGPDPPTAENYVPPDPTLIPGTKKLYLVESMGDLLLVVRYIEHYPDKEPKYCTNWFDVYKLNHSTKKWIAVDELGDQAIFVGDCQTFVLSSPESVNCRSNSIYFADDNYFRGKKNGRDMGIFDFQEGTIQPLYEGADSLSFYSTPTWFVPSFV